MPKAKLFGGSFKSRVIVSLERHAHKKKGTKTGLSAQGIAAARAKGLVVPRGFKVKGYHSPVSRAATTLKLGHTFGKKRGIAVYPVIRMRKELHGEDFIRNMDAAVAMMGKIGEPRLLRNWLDGKVSASVIDSPESVADRIIKKRFRFGKRVFEKGGKKILLRGVSHSWNVEAVFERLTGKKFQATSPRGTVVRPTEGLAVSFLGSGKAVLEYRGKRYDVTKRLLEITSK